MPRIGEMMPSKFLKKDDVGEEGVVVTIRDVLELNVAREDQEAEMKWSLLLKEFPKKPMVLNSTNLQMLAKACGSDDTDDWIDQKVILYNDPNIMFAGKMTGGIRVRAIKKKPPVQAPREPGSDDDEPVYEADV